jgi:hypothetical protein
MPLVALLAAVGVLLGLSGPAAAAPRTGTAAAVPFSGTTAAGDVVNGVFTVNHFAVQNGALTAIGTATGTVTNAAGTTSFTSTPATSAINLQQSTGSCQILDLTLGPLHLDLLGLVVDLNQVHLTITAQQGPGNLLGNLLCAVAGLLNGPTGLQAILNQIAALLNQILGAL